ncbi:MAG: hypothetical protein NZ699_12070 [Roseiflexus sp.]|nr:hypothetical protein [Roseiflexus sp.]MDW8145136.1 hypothetical protein [Roseiflexaceae bacterium]
MHVARGQAAGRSAPRARLRRWDAHVGGAPAPVARPRRWDAHVGGAPAPVAPPHAWSGYVFTQCLWEGSRLQVISFRYEHSA